MDKEFVGKAALKKQHNKLTRKMVQMEVFGWKTAIPPQMNQSLTVKKWLVVPHLVHMDTEPDRAFAMCYLEIDYAKVGTELEMEILGDKFKAVVIEESPYDPKNERLRG